MAVDRLFTFSLGDLPVPIELMVPGADPADMGPVPMGTMLAHAPEGWFLFDVGLSVDFRRPEVYEPTFVWGPPVLPGDGDPLLDALAACGVGVGEIAGVALSHMHTDHTGGLRHFSGTGTPVIVQQAELDETVDAPGPFHQFDDWVPYDLAWQPLTGPAAIATGIEAIPSPGHSRGHQSFLLTLASGARLLFAFDAVPLAANLERDVVTDIVSAGADNARASQAMLRRLAEETGARLVPGHCPETWRSLPVPPAFLS